MSAASPPLRPWLFGPASDLLLGCGLLYAGIMTAYAVWGADLRGLTPVWFVALITMLFSMPHYGATLLRVYEQRRERHRYAIFAVYTTLVMLVISIFGVYDAYLGSVLVTLYLTWSPWHYTGQNYGIAVMFLRRRGLAVTPVAKRLLYASFALSYLLTFIVMHGLVEAGYAPLGGAKEQVRFLPLGLLPRETTMFVVPVLAAAGLACLVAASVLLARSGRLRDLTPAWVLALTQALWFSIPYGVATYGQPIGIEPFDVHLTGLIDYRAWIWVGHGVQYLWVTTYYARAERGWSGYGSYLTKAAVAGIAIWTLPFIVFAPDGLGLRSYEGGLALVVAAAVNLHHFILDGAIWKLRHSRIAAVLIRDDRAEAAEPIEPGGRRWLSSGVWAASLLCVAGAVYAFWIQDFAYLGAWNRGDFAACSRMLDRMAWLGRDDEGRRTRLGDVAVERGDFDEALRQYERAAELQPSAFALRNVAQVRVDRGDLAGASGAYDELLRVAPDDPDGLVGAAVVRLELRDAEGALRLLERAAARYPADPTIRELVVRARQGVTGVVAPAAAPPPLVSDPPSPP